jgi:hypothetical protein
MRDNLAEAQRCRERAEHLRMLAARNEIVQIQDALLAVARDYEGLASEYLRRAQQKGAA